MSDNINNRLEQHGGNLSFIAKHFSNAPKPYIDLSTGINPYAYPLQENREANHRLADIDEMEVAHQTAAKYYNTNAENITLASGMQPLMFALAALRLQKHGKAQIGIFSPTYSEYEKIWKVAGHDVKTITDTDNDTNVIIICNPNNPDAKTYTPEFLLSIANNLAEKNGWLIVDEAFGDLLPELSITSKVASHKNIIVMRSLGKFFGLAGMRVSAAIAPKEINDYLCVVCGSWAISTNAATSLPHMFSDKSWAENMQVLLKQEAENWQKILAEKFSVIGHTPLFTLVETDDANYWFEYLAGQGILTRKFSYNPRWLRFGLPDSKNLDRIKTALKEGKI